MASLVAENGRENHQMSVISHTLAGVLRNSQQAYSLANIQSLKAHNDACSDLPGGNTRTVLHASPFPITFVNGSGCELTSLDGSVYTDFLGEFTAGIFGHSNEKIREAVSVAMGKGWNFGGPNLYERELARKVINRFSPSGIELVRFTNSGTESNTMAIAAAVAFTGRKKILAFKNGYHGGTLSFPSSLKDVNVNLPHDFVLAPYNDIEGTKAVIASMPENSLAVVMECIQGSGGCIVGTTEFLQFLDTTTKEIGALFIIDEVMTSRLSYHGYASTLGLKPDLVTLGKWIGGGMTFGAFGGRKDLMSMFDPRSGVLGHSGTFNNNIVTMAAGCAGMEIYNEEQVKRLNALGEDLKSRLDVILLPYRVNAEKTEVEAISSGAEEVKFKSSEKGTANRMWVTGKGSMFNIHFAGESADSLSAILWHHMLEYGIYMAQRGFIVLNIELKETDTWRFVAAVEVFVKTHLAFAQGLQ